MSDRSVRRVVGGVSALAVAAGFAVTAGVAVASAAPGSVTWTDGSSKFTRTISEANPAVGDVVTMTTKFERTGGVVEWLQAVKDVHPACLTYVAGSAKVSGSGQNPESQGADFVRVTGNWPVYPNINPKSQTFEFSYKVGADCARGAALSTSMYYGGSLGAGNYGDKGPSVTVRKDVSTTVLAPVTGAQVGQASTLSATVTGGANGDTVEFYDGASKLGTGALNNGVATYAWTPAAGAHSLVAKYLATGIADASQSAAQNVNVSAPDVSTTTQLTAPASVVEGASATLAAQVAPTPAGGTVQFKDGDANLGAAVAVGADGKASLTQVLPVGAHQITAVFSGVAGFTGSTSAAQTVTVTAAVPVDQATTTTVTAPVSVVEGASATLAAQVAPTPAGGTVQFKDGDANLGAAVAVGADGKASLTQVLPVGAHQITAVFSGVAGFTGSTSAAQTVTVTAAVPVDKATTTTLSVPGSAKTGQAVHVYATVKGPDSALIGSTGTVVFTIDGQAGAPVNVVGGVADLTQTFATAGTKSVTARFSGATGFATSTSAAGSVVVVDPAPSDVATTTTLTVPATAVKGTAVDLTATVAPAAAGGTVQFLDGATPIGTPVQVVGGKATLSYAFTATGDRSITAVYSGASGYQASTAGAHTIAVADGGDNGGGSGSLSSLFGS
ncbi:Ig-like domain-containing protein [Rhodococcus sp. NPDC059234]|uniref:Ig-like domain-containing protein n=1 Tax=Rhodococcus sp. NPDC059234 TaxID=3346781 RepID=UPI00366D6618